MIQGQKTQLSDFGVNLTPDEKAKATSTFDDGSLMLQALVDSIKTDGVNGLMKILTDPNSSKGLIGGGQGSSSSNRPGSGTGSGAGSGTGSGTGSGAGSWSGIGAGSGTGGTVSPMTIGPRMRPLPVSPGSSISVGGNGTASHNKDADYEAYYKELLAQYDDHHSN